MLDLAPPLPPPPRGPRRLARGSAPPLDLGVELEVTLRVREIAPGAWSRVVPVSPRTGEPLLARDRRRAARRRGERLATALVGGLAVLVGALATLLVT